MERKEFLSKTIALCGLGVLPLSLIESCSKQSYAGPSNVNFTLDLTATANAALNHVGGVVYSNGLIVIRTSSAGFVALSSTCTHAGCQVGYSSSNAVIVCPCHGGMYNPSTGAVISGPPPSPLTVYSVTRASNTLTIKG